MTTRDPNRDPNDRTLLTHIRATLDRVAAEAQQRSESDPEAEAMAAAVTEVVAFCRTHPATALERMIMQCARSRQQVDQLIQVIQQHKAQLKEGPQLMRVLGEPFAFGNNGDERQLVFVAPPGRMGEVRCVCLTEEDQQPAPMDYCFTDEQRKFYLAPATGPLPLRHFEQDRVISAAPQTDGGQLGEVVIEEGQDKQTVLFAEAQLAAEVAERLEQGQTVIVRHDRSFVERIVESKGPPVADWLEFPPLEGPTLDELVFPRWLAKAWQKDVRRMVQGKAGFRVALIGPTGVGKTEGVIRAGREAARRSNRRHALLRISAPHVGSSYYSETERTIARAIRQARKLAAEGLIVTMLLDEADALLGNSEGRYEGSVDRRVRQSLQELLSDQLKGVAVYATMNPRRDSWLPPAIDRRFLKRKYPRPWRSQMAKVAAGYVCPDALRQLQVKPREFGSLVADYLFSDRFVVATLYMHSGRTIPVHARDLHNCSPGKLRDLILGFCEDLLDEQETEVKSLHSLWLMLDREFSSHCLNENNLFELTFLSKPAHDSVKKVEAVGARTSH